MIYVLAGLLLLLLVLLLYIDRGDWLSPAVVLTTSFLFSVVCAIYNISRWDIDLSVQTVAIIFGGVFLFGLFCLVVRSILAILRAGRAEKSVPTLGVRAIRMGRRYQVALFAFFVLATLIYYRQLNLSFSTLGVAGEGWNDMMSAYRDASSDVTQSGLTTMPTWVVYLYNTMHALAFVVLYVVINNLFAGRGEWRHDILLFGCAAIYLASVILLSGRLPILEYVFAAALIVWIVWHRVHGWRSKVHLRYIVVSLLITIGVLVLFSALRWLVGRTSDEDVVTYVTSYAGGSIQLFDLFLKNPTPSSGIFGQETFRGIVSALGRHLGDSSLNFSWQLEFRYSTNGVMLGNVYTAFRYWIYDFGYLGWLVMLFVYALIYTLFHQGVRTHTPLGHFDAVLTVYAYLFSGLVMLPIQDVLFAMDCNPGGAYMLACILVFGWLLVERPQQVERRAQCSADVKT